MRSPRSWKESCHIIRVKKCIDLGRHGRSVRTAGLRRFLPTPFIPPIVNLPLDSVYIRTSCPLLDKLCSFLPRKNRVYSLHGESDASTLFQLTATKCRRHRSNLFSILFERGRSLKHARFLNREACGLQRGVVRNAGLGETARLKKGAYHGKGISPVDFRGSV